MQYFNLGGGNSIRFATGTSAPMPAPYLLDSYPATAAFSVRKLSSTATLCMRVRRSSDNAEQDIGFVGDNLDTASLLSFVGAANGFVTKWYNQGTGGITYDTSQTTASNQPRIVNSGNLETDNGKVAVNFVSADTLSSSNSITQTLQYSTICVASRYVANSIGVVMSIGSYRNYLDRTANKLISRLERVGTYWDAAMLSQVDSSLQRLNETYSNNSGATGYYNSVVQLTDTTGANPPYPNEIITIGTGLGGIHTGYISEIIHFLSDESANRLAIELNINTYYGIY
jgi:hypothetical protein